MGKKKDDRKKKDAREKLPLDTVVAELPQAITQAARSMRTALSRNLLDAGLYAGQDGVMRALAGEDGLTPGGLAQRLGVKAPTMTRTVGRMEQQGFVERRADDEDQRLTKVYLTETGRNSLEAIGQSVDQCAAQALSGFSGKEMRSLLKLLKALDENLKNGDASTTVSVFPDDEN
nr:MarR family transcriptional regulator [uncultured Gellertiella sp.]